MHVEAFKIGTWVSNAFLSAFASTFSAFKADVRPWGCDATNALKTS